MTTDGHTTLYGQPQRLLSATDSMAFTNSHNALGPLAAEHGNGFSIAVKNESMRAEKSARPDLLARVMRLGNNDGR